MRSSGEQQDLVFGFLWQKEYWRLLTFWLQTALYANRQVERGWVAEHSCKPHQAVSPAVSLCFLSTVSPFEPVSQIKSSPICSVLSHCRQMNILGVVKVHTDKAYFHIFSIWLYEQCGTQIKILPGIRNVGHSPRENLFLGTVLSVQVNAVCGGMGMVRPLNVSAWSRV